MANFRGIIQGNRGEASRLGSKSSGLSSFISGWDSGVLVCAVHVDGVDQFRIYATRGSNGGGSELIGHIQLDERNEVVFSPRGGSVPASSLPYDTAGIFAVREDPARVRHPSSAVAEIHKRIAGEDVELFAVLTIDGAHQIIDLHVISRGSVNRALVHPRDVFRAAINDNAVAIIVAHNHPSGNTEPSQEDKDLTKRLKSAGDLVGIALLDHVVISPYEYYSFLEHDEI